MKGLFVATLLVLLLAFAGCSIDRQQRHGKRTHRVRSNPMTSADDSADAEKDLTRRKRTDSDNNTTISDECRELVQREKEGIRESLRSEQDQLHSSHQEQLQGLRLEHSQKLLEERRSSREHLLDIWRRGGKCCKSDSNWKCKDGSKGTPCCGKRGCNIWCCNCDDICWGM